MPPDDPALVADFLDARLDLHGVPNSSRTFETRSCETDGERPGWSLVAVDDAAPGEVVGRELHDNPVFRQDADVVLPHLAADVRQDLVAIGELYPKHRVRERLDHSALDLDGPVLLRHVLRYLTSGLVNGTQHPFRDRRLLRSRASRGSGRLQKRMQGTPEWTLCANRPVYACVPVTPNWRSRVAATAPAILPALGPFLGPALEMLLRIAAHDAGERGREQERTPGAGHPHRPEVHEVSGGQADQEPDHHVDGDCDEPGAPYPDQPFGHVAQRLTLELRAGDRGRVAVVGGAGHHLRVADRGEAG